VCNVQGLNWFVSPLHHEPNDQERIKKKRKKEFRNCGPIHAFLMMESDSNHVIWVIFSEEHTLQGRMDGHVLSRTEQ
jgi:hypothetical protein